MLFFTIKLNFVRHCFFEEPSNNRYTLNRKIEWVHDTENPSWSLNGGGLLQNNTTVKRLAAAASSLQHHDGGIHIKSTLRLSWIRASFSASFSDRLVKSMIFWLPLKLLVKKCSKKLIGSKEPPSNFSGTFSGGHLTLSFGREVSKTPSRL